MPGGGGGVAGGSGVGAVAVVDGHRLGVDDGAAGRREREGDGAGGVVAAGEDRRVGQRLTAADDHRPAGDGVEPGTRDDYRLGLVLAIVDGGLVVGISAVGGRPL